MESRKLELRRANEGDCRDIYNWRVHPIARTASRNQEEIPYANHQEWFKETLRDPNRIIYVATEGDKKIGQVRFDKKSEAKSEVSISIDPQRYGQGYGTEILNEGSARYFSEHSDSNVILAEIRSTNVSSIRAFQKAGYKELDSNKGENGDWKFLALFRK